MNPKQIEIQVEANNRETRQIIHQLANGVQRQELLNRLEMLKKAEVYWANEYFKLTGKQLGLSSPLPVSTPSPNTSNPQNGAKQDSMAEWQSVRERIKQSLTGNPNQGRVEAYLNVLERTYGGQPPKLPNAVVFGKASLGRSENTQDFNAFVIPANSSMYFDEGNAVIIFSNGAVANPTNRTLMVFYKPAGRKPFTGKVEVNYEEIKKALKALRGE